MRSAISAIALTVLFGSFGESQAQTPPPNPTHQQVPPGQSNVPLYRVTVVGRSTPAVNYRYRSGETPIDFRGTALLPRASGRAKVETKRGFSDIDAHFGHLAPASTFGPEYLTYVMWAITPDGRADNLGEVLLNGDDSKLHVTTEMQAFALIVTAEPYFAVTQPSDVVVLENDIRPETVGNIEHVDAKYELLKRGSYVMGSTAPYVVHRVDPSIPLELREARNAVDLARLAGADRYAPDTYARASQSLEQAEGYQRRGAGKKPVIMMARAAAQTAEDARLIALERQIAEQTAAANDAAARRELETIARARDEADRARKAEAERAAAEQDRARAEEAADRLVKEKADAEAALARAAKEKAEAEAQRAAAEQAKADAQQASRVLAEQKAQADAARQASEAARQASEAEAIRARSDAQRAELDKAELRERLRDQLNVILETRESARGLIVNMSDVLFDSGRATLRPGAREKLAKVAGIVLAYPGLRLQVEGHTDSIGPADYNQDLSERRANAVRAFLIDQGVTSDTIGARGFGDTRPVATNGTGTGRQENRRVELIVSGSPIQ